VDHYNAASDALKRLHEDYVIAGMRAEVERMWQAHKRAIVLAVKPPPAHTRGCGGAG
jgi:hypothetical protein